MQQNDLFFTLALLQVEGIGDVISKRLLQNFDTAEEVFKAKKTTLAKIDGVGKLLIENLKNPSVFQKAEKELFFLEQEKIKVLFYKDDIYPERLKHCFDAPVILFQSGNVEMKQQKLISIVGTRKMTTYGSDFTRRFIEDLAPLNPTIISGFAYGVDILSHQMAMDHGLQTIGVLAHGLNQIYPKNHKRYMVKMEQKGGFLTEFWTHTKPDRENFVKRNRIVAGISEAIIVIESAEKGGSLITAQIANDYNREVFAVPGRAGDKYSQGCNHLIKTQRAQLLTSAADLVYMLNWEVKKKEPKPVQKQLFVSLTPEEQKVYDFLFRNGREHLDSLSQICGIPVFKLSGILLNMELKGVVKPLPGKSFEAI
ncbi:DNA-processing protein DprA [Flavobacterium sp. NRK F10]|uniref:DNA-protecting protein DprA n=1 Tax=Flavobacterium sediminis TaxID=2201181 RepID=A0A2U8QUM2_9FLAO|nr:MULTISPECIES: DNA-processing protein DprA [Flavobacterium]AWM13495.1 DNA-protecting protein DprA [Flavobacterium sediminis]MCO6174867.1 DNA-processing protein DprA [Flavobacterium sp. NRK F10]